MNVEVCRCWGKLGWHPPLQNRSVWYFGAPWRTQIHPKPFTLTPKRKNTSKRKGILLTRTFHAMTPNMRRLVTRGSRIEVRACSMRRSNTRSSSTESGSASLEGTIAEQGSPSAPPHDIYVSMRQDWAGRRERAGAGFHTCSWVPLNLGSTHFENNLKLTLLNGVQWILLRTLTSIITKAPEALRLRFWMAAGWMDECFTPHHKLRIPANALMLTWS